MSRFITFLLSTLLFSNASPVVRSSSALLAFTEFISNYSKTYDTSEYDLRFEIFKHNMNIINTHNSRNLNWKMAINEYTDLTWEEFKKEKTFVRPIKPNYQTVTRVYNEIKEVPTELDWRNLNVLNPVKNQEQCGSCWAFSAIGAVESAVAIKTGVLYDLSEQQLVDCSTNYGNAGCNGGLMDYAFQYAVENKLCSEQEYSYTGQDGTCRSCEGLVNVKGFVDVQQSNETALLYSLIEQPISIAVEADQYGFQFYSSGVFDGSCGTNLDHGVLLVGYGKENGLDYWLVRNSWGEYWGDKGYIKLVRGVNQCGISLAPSFPVV